ncbi:MAG: hypothetical protein AAGH74_15455 [Pseudomonadota bacterium]
MTDLLVNDALKNAPIFLIWLSLALFLSGLGAIYLPWHKSPLPDKAGRQRASSDRYFFTVFGLLLLSQIVDGLSRSIIFVRETRRYGWELDFLEPTLTTLMVSGCLVLSYRGAKRIAKPNEHILRRAELDGDTLCWQSLFGEKGKARLSEITQLEINLFHWSGDESKLSLKDGTLLKFPRNLLGGASLMNAIQTEMDLTRPTRDGAGSD